MKKFVKKLDIYGEGIKLRIHNSEKSETIIGGILTILTALIMLVFIILTGSDIFYKRKPTSYNEHIILDSHPQINLNRSTFPLSFYVGDNLGNILNNSDYFTIKVYQKHVYQTTKGIYEQTNTVLNYSICETEDFTDNITAVKNQLIGLSYCIDNQNISLRGYWTDTSLDYLSINLQYCDSEINKNCKNITEIEDFIQNNQVNLNLYTLETSVSITNYSYPFTKYLNNPYSYTYKTMTKYSSFFIQNQTLKTDDGFFTELFHNSYFLKLINNQKEFAVQDSDLNAIIFEFYSSNQNDIIYRSYVKITNIFGSIGGILKLLMLFFKYLNMPFTRVQKYATIANYLTDTDMFRQRKARKLIKANLITENKLKSINMQDINIDKNDLKNPLSKESNNSINNSINVSAFNINSLSNVNIDKNVSKIENEAKKMDSRLHFDTIELLPLKIKRMFRCKIKRQNQIDKYNKYLKVSDNIKEFFEVSNFINKINKLEKLKFLLLDNDYADMFDAVFDPNIPDIELIKSKISEFLKSNNKDYLESKLESLILKYKSNINP